MPLDAEWIRCAEIDDAGIERRAAEIHQSRPVERGQEIAALLTAVSCLDLTMLGDDDSSDDVRFLCSRAARPFRPEVLERLGAGRFEGGVAAVCVFDRFAAVATNALADTGIAVAAVSGGFPFPLERLAERVRTVRDAVTSGACEIDAVITRDHVLKEDWHALHEDVHALREACGSAALKTILGTGEIDSLANVARASLVCMMAGADFIKTSTGREAVNATLPAGLAIATAIRDYQRRTGYPVGLKPAGGIRTYDQALDWVRLVVETLGPDWLTPSHFRIGASALLGSIETRLMTFTGEGASQR